MTMSTSSKTNLDDTNHLEFDGVMSALTSPTDDANGAADVVSEADDTMTPSRSTEFDLLPPFTTPISAGGVSSPRSGSIRMANV
jgi:hypothetical protein